MESVNRNAIAVHDLSFYYRDRRILNNINIEIPKGCITFVLGKNGSGKSTLLKLIAGLLPFRQGNITILNRPLSSLSYKNKAALIGYMGQQHQAVFPFSVFEVVLTGRSAFAGYAPTKKDLELVHEVIEQTAITHLIQKPYTELSGGEQQLVMFARVLAQQPSVLLLDEPVSNLDLYNQAKFYHLLKTIAQQKGITVLITVHDPNHALLHGDYFLYLKNGNALPIQEKTQAADIELLRDIYGIHFHKIDYENKIIVIPDII